VVAAGVVEEEAADRRQVQHRRALELLEAWVR
jgi:hypothetical protein